MTVSATRRLADQELVLRTLALELGDEMVARRWWDVDRADFADVIPTTWVELTEQGYLERHRRLNPPSAYELTETGWIAGLQLAGAFEDDAFRARCVGLVKFFKLQVDGRRQHHDSWLSAQEIHNAGFPWGWTLNALRGGLLGTMFPDKRMNVSWDERSKNVRVPVTFGMPE